MAEYIKREDALAVFHDWFDKYGDVHEADEIVEYQAIEALPAADVVERKHGKWIPDEYSYSGPCTYNYVCSVCGKTGGTWYRDIKREQTFPICPFCGAEMWGEVNDE